MEEIGQVQPGSQVAGASGSVDEVGVIQLHFKPFVNETLNQDEPHPVFDSRLSSRAGMSIVRWSWFVGDYCATQPALAVSQQQLQRNVLHVESSELG